MLYQRICDFCGSYLIQERNSASNGWCWAIRMNCLYQGKALQLEKGMWETRPFWIAKKVKNRNSPVVTKSLLLLLLLRQALIYLWLTLNSLGNEE